MYIHFHGDSDYSQFFIEFINANFDEKNHLHIVISNKKLKYIKECQKVHVVSLRDYKSIKSIKALLATRKTEEIKCYYHFLTEQSIILTHLLGLNRKSKYWVIWGADLYSYINYDLYSTNTKKYLTEKSIENKSLLKSTIYSLYRKVLLYSRNRFIPSLTGILTWNQGDYELACKHYHVKPDRLDFVYNLGIEKNEPLDNGSTIKKNRKTTIMVGNSGDPTNNHIDIYNLLTKMNGDFKVLSFLTYGEPHYIQKIIEAGYELLGERFIPITNHMPREEYFNFIEEIDVVIMNHYRQQGVGNIVSFLQKGKKVYINDFVTTFKYFTDNDVSLYSISELENIDHIDELQEYSEEIKYNNSEKVYELFSDKASLEKMKKIFK